MENGKEKKEKKKRNAAKPIAGVAVIAVIAAVVVGVLGHFGIGFGGENGDGENDSVQVDATVSETAESETSASAEEILYIDVTVSENSYIYQNSTLTLDELIAELKESEGNSIVKISDENASQKAYSELTDALNENGIQFTEAVSE